jgi:hypothetical protein
VNAEERRGTARHARILADQALNGPDYADSVRSRALASIAHSLAVIADVLVGAVHGGEHESINVFPADELGDRTEVPS